MTAAILIGNTDNKLTQQEWADFVFSTSNVIREACNSTYFKGGPSTFEPFQNACFVVDINHSETESLRSELSNLAKRFRQDSIAFMAGETEFIKPCL